MLVGVAEQLESELGELAAGHRDQIDRLARVVGLLCRLLGRLSAPPKAKAAKPAEPAAEPAPFESAFEPLPFLPEGFGFPTR